MKRILVSQCLYGGVPVRYDGKSKEETDPMFLKWKEEGRLIPVCPEVWGGLPVPRVDAQRREDQVVTRDGRDVTEEYMNGAREAVGGTGVDGRAVTEGRIQGLFGGTAGRSERFVGKTWR